MRVSAERALRGVGAAPGVSSGIAVVLGRNGAARTETIPPGGRSAELAAAQRALKSTSADLGSIAAALRSSGRTEEADIVETGMLMASDPELMARVEALVVGSGRPAAEALREAADQVADQLALIPDPLLAERADDVRSLGRRAARRATGISTDVPGGVIVADTLGPADVAELGVAAGGVALAGGGVTAHAAIVARSLGIPMVVGLGPELLQVEAGEEVVLDGDAGLLIQRPTARRIGDAHAMEARRRLAREEARADRLEPAVTRDGRRVTVLANASSVAEVIEALEQGAEGIGLLRTELGFLDASDWPSFEQQLAFLNPVLARLEGRTATVRLLDFGGDKTPPFMHEPEGRGIELLLQSPQSLNTQLAAIVEAGMKTRLRILVPMVTAPDQLRAVRQALAIVVGDGPSPTLGAMIETPDAARRAREIAGEAEFLSLGTNDLTQLVLGLDRERSKSAPVTDIRVLSLIDTTMQAARASGIPVDVCGESASDAAAMPILVGLGADELSVAAARVGEVRRWIRNLDYSTCRDESAKLLFDQAADASGKGG